MLLVDHELISLVEQVRGEGQPPLLDPFVDHKVRGDFPSYGLQSAGYDLRLNPVVGLRVFKAERICIPLSPLEPERQTKSTWIEKPISRKLVLLPGFLALGSSLEHFNMPSNVLGLCHGKSTYSRLGLIMNVTPIEPGWRGFLTIEMFNHNPNPVEILVEGGILQVTFHLLSSVPKALYSGAYQDQKAEVVPARVGGSKEMSEMDELQIGAGTSQMSERRYGPRKTWTLTELKKEG